MARIGVDIPVTDLDTFVRYVLGIRRFTAAHIEAVDRYLVTSWGEDMAELATALFLQRFQILEDRRAPIRFTRKVPALVDTRQVVTWRPTPAGAAAIGIGPIPADVPSWAELPGGWEVLVVLWATAGETREDRSMHLAVLRSFGIRDLGPVGQRITEGRGLTGADIAEVTSRLNPSLSPLAALDRPNRLRRIAAQLRWLQDAGLAERNLWKPPHDITQPYQYVDQWGWQWLRRAVDPDIPPLATTPLLEIYVARALGRGWDPVKRVTEANRENTVAYQRTQALIDRLFDSHPGRWRGCAQEFSYTGLSFFGDKFELAAGLPIPADDTPPAGSTTSYRRPDAVLWQPGDAYNTPTVLIEYQASATPSRVTEHLALALHIATRSQRDTIIVFVVTGEARRPLTTTLQRALQRLTAPRLHGLWRGAHLHVRLVTYKQAMDSDPLSCQAILDETIHIPAQPPHPSRLSPS